jgi:4'-phosphopantetheinyl transferase
MLLPAHQSVHIWQVTLLQDVNCLARLQQTLSPDELTHAQRFHFERDRRRYIVGRGVLREILARYLGQDAGQIVFAYTERGKPYLPKNPLNIHFNLAHSHEMAVYAVTVGHEVGVDIEHIHPVAEMDQIVERFFSPTEIRAWRALPEAQKPTGFFNCWTRKEAYIKATGEGLSKPLDQFAVSLAPDEPARLLCVDGDENEAQRWSLHALRLDQNDYAGALAIRSPSISPNNLEMFSWPPQPASPGLHQPGAAAGPYPS